MSRACATRVGRTRERYRCFCEQVDVEYVRRQRAQIDAVRDDHGPGGFELLVQRVERRWQTTQDPRALDFVRQIPPQTVAANAHHIGRPTNAPVEIRAIPNSGGSSAGCDFGQIDERVDACDECFGDALRIGTVREPFAVHVAAIQETAVPRDPARRMPGPRTSDNCSEAATTPRIDLPQSIARGVESLNEKRVVVRARVDVRNSPFVDQNFGRLFEPAN